MIDQTALSDYKAFQFYLDNRTLFDGVTQDRTMYQPKKSNEPLRKVLEESVYDCVTNIQVGCYVSGGIDSSTVAMIADQEIVIDGFHGYFPDDPECNETEYAELLPIQLYKVPIVQQDFVDNIEDVIRCLRYPVAGVGSFSQYMVAKTAKEHCNVILSGEGGDELFGGYSRYIVAQLEQYIKLAMDGDARPLQSFAHNLTHLKGYEPMVKSFFGKGMFRTRNERYYELVLRGQHSDSAYRRFIQAFNDDGSDYLRLMMKFDYNHVLPALLHVDKSINEHFGLEGHAPMLDERVVDVAYSSPVVLGEPKYELIKAVRGLVPEKILNRKGKMGFPTPFIKWVRQDGVVREYVKGVLGEIPDEETYGRQLWGELCLALWRKQNEIV